MTWLLIGGGLLIYITGSYYLMYRDLKRSAGPTGLGWFAFPLAPLMLPMMIGMYLVSLPKRLGRALTEF